MFVEVETKVSTRPKFVFHNSCFGNIIGPTDSEPEQGIYIIQLRPDEKSVFR